RTDRRGGSRLQSLHVAREKSEAWHDIVEHGECRRGDVGNATGDAVVLLVSGQPHPGKHFELPDDRDVVVNVNAQVLADLLGQGHGPRWIESGRVELYRVVNVLLLRQYRIVLIWILGVPLASRDTERETVAEKEGRKVTDQLEPLERIQVFLFHGVYVHLTDAGVDVVIRDADAVSGSVRPGATKLAKDIPAVGEKVIAAKLEILRVSVEHRPAPRKQVARVGDRSERKDVVFDIQVDAGLLGNVLSEVLEVRLQDELRNHLPVEPEAGELAVPGGVSNAVLQL